MPKFGTVLNDSAVGEWEKNEAARKEAEREADHAKQMAWLEAEQERSRQEKELLAELDEDKENDERIDQAIVEAVEQENHKDNFVPRPASKMRAQLKSRKVEKEKTAKKASKKSNNTKVTIDKETFAALEARVALLEAKFDAKESNVENSKPVSVTALNKQHMNVILPSDDESLGGTWEDLKNEPGSLKERLLQTAQEKVYPNKSKYQVYRSVGHYFRSRQRRAIRKRNRAVSTTHDDQ